MSILVQTLKNIKIKLFAVTATNYYVLMNDYVNHKKYILVMMVLIKFFNNLMEESKQMDCKLLKND